MNEQTATPQDVQSHISQLDEEIARLKYQFQQLDDPLLDHSTLKNIGELCEKAMAVQNEADMLLKEINERKYCITIISSVARFRNWAHSKGDFFEVVETFGRIKHREENLRKMQVEKE